MLPIIMAFLVQKEGFVNLKIYLAALKIEVLKLK